MNHQDFGNIVFRKYIHNKPIHNHINTDPIDKIANADECDKHTNVGKSLATTIQNARISKGFKTQREFAQKLNLPVAIINQYETGKAMPDNKIMQRLRTVLGKLN